jgi:hypothetical protein
MARHFGSITTTIWDDEDWWALTGEQQRCYLMLITQGDISPVGTLPMTLKRWANSTRGCDIDGLSETLRQLSDAAYVVIDWQRETLLVRSFVRWDKGFTNSKRLIAIQSNAKAIGSKLIGGVLAHELNRLGISHEIRHPPIDALSMGHRSPIDDESIHAGSGYVSNYLPEPEPEPFPGTGSREPEPADGASAAAVAAPKRGTRIPDQFFITDKMREWADGEVPGLDLSWYTRKFVDHWRSSTRNATKLDWVATWQNWMRSEFEKPGHRRINGRASPPKPSTTDQRVGDALALRERYLAEEQTNQQRSREIEA